MTYFKETFMLNNEEKKQVSEMSGKIILWILEGRSIGYMSAMLHLSPQEIESNINETLFVLKKHVGKRRFFKILLAKQKVQGI